MSAFDELPLNNSITIDWPFDKPLPEISDRFNAGDFGTAVVGTIQVINYRGGRRPIQRVRFEIFQSIQVHGTDPAK